MKLYLEDANDNISIISDLELQKLNNIKISKLTSLHMCIEGDINIIANVKVNGSWSREINRIKIPCKADKFRVFAPGLVEVIDCLTDNGIPKLANYLETTFPKYFNYKGDLVSSIKRCVRDEPRSVKSLKEAIDHKVLSMNDIDLNSIEFINLLSSAINQELYYECNYSEYIIPRGTIWDGVLQTKRENGVAEIYVNQKLKKGLDFVNTVNHAIELNKY